MAVLKQRKIDGKRRAFQDKWTHQCFFIAQKRNSCVFSLFGNNIEYSFRRGSSREGHEVSNNTHTDSKSSEPQLIWNRAYCRRCTVVIKIFLLPHRLWMATCLLFLNFSCLIIILFLLHCTWHVSIKHCTDKPTFVLSFIYMCDIIWPPAPFQSCYLARNLKEVARA